MSQQLRSRRHKRIRNKIRGTAERPRASVFRSNRQITVQLIDDGKQRTLAAATGQVQEVASSIVKQAAKHKIKQIVYDRGGYRYHGQVKALAETIRKGGLKF